MNLYLVTTFRTPLFQSTLLDSHYEFLEHLRQQGLIELAGPFADRSGGAYVMRASNLDEAKALAFSDPLHTSQSSTVRVYEWLVR